MTGNLNNLNVYGWMDDASSILPITNTLTIDAGGNLISEVEGVPAILPIADFISADPLNSLTIGSDGLLYNKTVVIFDDQILTMIDTNTIDGTLVPSLPIGSDNQVNYTVEMNVKVSSATIPYLNAITVNPDGLYVPLIPDVVTNYVDTTTVPKHQIGTYTNEAGTVQVVNETVTPIVDNLDGTYTYTREDGVVQVINTNETVSYSVEPAVFPATPRIGDEHFTTTTGIAPLIVSEVINQYIWDGVQWTIRPKAKEIVIPTPRIWARNRVTTNVNQGTDINSISTVTWNIPEIYAQNFSPNDALWRTLNPVYELIVHKKVKGYPNRITKNTYKWVHPVNGQPGSTGKKYAAGSTKDHNNGTTWDDRFTEWTTDLASVPTFLKNLDPHDFMSFKAGNLTVNGFNPIVGAWSENSFREVFCFAPKRAARSGNIKMAFAVRIRVDNPEFIPGVAGQEPYLYGDASNVLVFKPSMFNLWDGSTVDIDNNNVLEHYFFGWRATEENSTQY